MHMSSEVNAGRCIRRSRSVDSPNTSHRMRTRAWRVQSLLPPVCLLLSLLGSGVVSPRFPSLCRRRRLLPGQTNAKLSAHVIDLSLVHPCRSDDRCLRKGSRRTDTVKSTALEAAFSLPLDEGAGRTTTSKTNDVGALTGSVDWAAGRTGGANDRSVNITGDGGVALRTPDSLKNLSYVRTWAIDRRTASRNW